MVRDSLKYTFFSQKSKFFFGKIPSKKHEKIEKILKKTHFFCIYWLVKMEICKLSSRDLSRAILQSKKSEKKTIIFSKFALVAHLAWSKSSRTFGTPLTLFGPDSHPTLSLL